MKYQMSHYALSVAGANGRRLWIWWRICSKHV